MGIRILIVEDDFNYRYALTKMISWEKGGCEIVGEAVNGKQALEILKKVPTDIVLTDVSMPIMDGIELTGQIRSTDFRTGIVILSAYDDFQFVKNALMLGADDYLLKQDMEEEHLLKMVSEVMEKRQGKNLSLYMHEHKFRKEIIKYLEQNIVLSEETVQFLNQKLYGRGAFLICVKEVENVEEKEAHLRESSQELLSLGMKGENEWIILCIRDKKDETKVFQDSWRICTELLESMSGKERVFFSEIARKTEDLYRVYQAFRSVTDFLFYNRDSKNIFSYIDLKSFEEKRNAEYLFLFDKYDQDKITLEKLEDILDEMTAAIEKQKPVQEYVDINFKNYLLFFRKCFSQFITEEKTVEAISRIKECKEVALKYQEAVKELRACEQYVRLGEFSSYQDIGKAIRYIMENYDKDLPLQKLADYVGLSESYLSTRFKQVTGENVINYINKLRIEKAKNMLCNTNMKVYEISYAVGFNNPTYFSTIFKKITGQSISEFRNKSQNI